MLPDFPVVKTDLEKRLMEFMRLRVGVHLGALNEIRQVTLREGKEKTRIVRESGEVEDTPLRLESVELVLRKEELGKLPLFELLQRIDAAAQKMAEQIARGMYETISAAVDKVGNNVDAQGKKMSAELILEGFRTIQIDFDPDGTPRLPDIHLHPALKDAAMLARKKLIEDPELRQQFRDLIALKREEWREREISRALVG